MSAQTEDVYLTIVSGADEAPVYKDKGSRFIGYAFHVENPEEVQDILARVRTEHHNARHVCYAYRMGPGGDVFRANDDGEPSGTAGLPIYNRILSAGLTDTLVVVVRYFGGVLLGAPGLVAAYRQAARMAVEGAGTEQRTVEQAFEVHFGYGQLSAVMRLVQVRGVRILEQDMREKCRFRLSMRLSQVGAVKEALAEIFGVSVE